MTASPGDGEQAAREGYYPDPSIPGYVRYWNGAAWVPGTSRPAPAQAAPPAPAPMEETGPVFLDETSATEALPESGVWQADPLHQGGFGGPRDHRVSWGSPADPAEHATGHASRRAAAPGAEHATARAAGHEGAHGAGHEGAHGAGYGAGYDGGHGTGPGAARPAAHAEGYDGGYGTGIGTGIGTGAGPGAARAAAHAAAARPAGTPAGRARPESADGPGAAGISLARRPFGGPAPAPAAVSASAALAAPAARLPSHAPAGILPARSPAAAPTALATPAAPAPAVPAPAAPQAPAPGWPDAPGGASGARGTGLTSSWPEAAPRTPADAPAPAAPAAPAPEAAGAAAPGWEPRAGGARPAPTRPVPAARTATPRAVFEQMADRAVRPAGLPRRIAARALDSLVLGAVAVAVALPRLPAATAHLQSKIDTARAGGRTTTVWLLDGTIAGQLGPALGAVLFFGLFYEVLPTARWGRTPGKKLLGVRVLATATLRPPTVGAALRRWLVYGLLGLPGSLWCLVDRPRRRAWHDRAAGTYVAR
ncbi:RDD family protein [Streptomyces subrutilus]|uniref:RDD family protein n=1 Tax=Streptomyces subrutilus TaxID=36818 RepID=UPI003444F943